jgi:GT2 family glycosyltransferase
VAAPLVHGSDGVLQDSARPLPTPWRILGKAVGLGSARDGPAPDFVAGMFMLFRAEAFARLGGFDERYFLYYEDVDICCRARLAGLEVLQERSCSVTHDGVRASHRRLRYLRWHLRSMARFFRSPVYRAARRVAAS